jgi:hypothetical protein
VKTLLSEDYIMRMISQAVVVIMAALGLKRNGQYNEALQTFDQAIESLLGLDAHLVNQLDDSSLIDMLTFQGRVDAGRMQVLADIFLEEAELYTLQGANESSHLAELRSLRLYLEAALASEGSPEPETLQKIESLRTKLPAATLPEITRLALLDYLERLLSEKDDILAAAGLSRPDVQNAFSELNKPDLT